MDIVVVGKHGDVDAALRALTIEKVERVDKFASDVRRIEVDYEHHPTRQAEDSHTCEILVHVRQHLVKGTAAATEYAIALDRALDKVEQQMRRLHERRVGRRNGTRAEARRAEQRPSRRARRRPMLEADDADGDDGDRDRREDQAVQREADGRRGGRAPDGAARPRLLPVHQRRVRWRRR